jgi:hypothetical protein
MHRADDFRFALSLSHEADGLRFACRDRCGFDTDIISIMSGFVAHQPISAFTSMTAGRQAWSWTATVRRRFAQPSSQATL